MVYIVEIRYNCKGKNDPSAINRAELERRSLMKEGMQEIWVFFEYYSKFRGRRE